MEVINKPGEIKYLLGIGVLKIRKFTHSTQKLSFHYENRPLFTCLRNTGQRHTDHPHAALFNGMGHETTGHKINGKARRQYGNTTGWISGRRV